MSGSRQVKLEVLYEDNHVLVVDKAAMLPTMGVSADKQSLLDIAKAYVKQKYNKPGNVYLGVVSRLDAPVTGALLIARTSKAAARLSKQFRDRSVEKVYLAIVEGRPSGGENRLEHWLRKDERHRKMHVTMKDTESAQRASLRYRVVRALDDDLTLLEITLETGRKHQIRVQLSAVGHPVVGDRKYKSSVHFSPGIALHSHRLAFDHPTKQHRIEVTCQPPKGWDVLLKRKNS